MKKSNKYIADPHSTWFMVNHSWSNWNLEVLVFEERRKQELPLVGKERTNNRTPSTQCMGFYNYGFAFSVMSTHYDITLKCFDIIASYFLQIIVNSTTMLKRPFSFVIDHL